MNEFAFGDRVRSSVKLEKWHTRETEAFEVAGHPFERSRSRRLWRTVPIADLDSWGKATTHRDGIVIGWRTLAEGDYNYGSYDEQASLSDQTYFRAYLVAFDMRRNPFLVRAEDLELIK